MRLEAYWLLSGALAGPWARSESLRFLILKVSFPEAFMPSPTLWNLGCKREPQGGEGFRVLPGTPGIRLATHQEGQCHLGKTVHTWIWIIPVLFLF